MRPLDANGIARIEHLAKGNGPAAERAAALLPCVRASNASLSVAAAERASQLLFDHGQDIVLVSRLLSAGLRKRCQSLVVEALQTASSYSACGQAIRSLFIQELATLEDRGGRGFIRELADRLHEEDLIAFEILTIREMVRRGSNGPSGDGRIIECLARRGEAFEIIVHGSAALRRWEMRADWVRTVIEAVKSLIASGKDDTPDLAAFLIECCGPFVLRAILEDRECRDHLFRALASQPVDKLCAKRRFLWNFAISGASIAGKESYLFPLKVIEPALPAIDYLSSILFETNSDRRRSLAGDFRVDCSVKPFAGQETEFLVLLLFCRWLAKGSLLKAPAAEIAKRDDVLLVMKLFRRGFGREGGIGQDFLRQLFLEVKERNPRAREALDLTAEMGLLDTEAKAREALAQVRQADDAKNREQLLALLDGLVRNDQLETAAMICREEEALLLAEPLSARAAADAYMAAQYWAEAGRAWSALAKLSRKPHWPLSSAYRAYARAGDVEAAKQIREAVDLSQPDTQQTLPALAFTACSIGDFAFAREVLKVAKPIFQSFDPERQRLLAAAQMQATGDIDLSPNPQPFAQSGPTPRALVIDPGFHYRSGHHFNYGRFAVDFLSTELEVDQEDVWLLVGNEERDAADNSLDGSLHEVFRFSPYAHRDVAVTEESIANLGKAFFRDLTAFSRSIDLSDCEVIYVHSMRANMIVGFSRWIAKTFGGRPITVVVGVIEVDYLIEPIKCRKLWARTNKRGLSRLHEMPNVRALLYCETERAWSHFRHLLGDTVPIHRFPYLAASLAGRIATRKEAALRDDVITFGTLGASTPNRGSDLFPELVGRFAERPEVNWVLQLSRGFVNGLGADHVNHLEHAVARGSCVWHDNRLSVADYYAAMRRIDVMILAYRDRYAVSGSGVFYEAIQLERFLVVPKQTFMEGVVRDISYPARLLTDVTVDSLQEAVETIVEEIDDQRRRLDRFGHEQFGRGRRNCFPIEKFRRLFRDCLHHSPPVQEALPALTA